MSTGSKRAAPAHIVVGATRTQNEDYLETVACQLTFFCYRSFFLHLSASAIPVSDQKFVLANLQGIEGCWSDFRSVRGGFQISCAQAFATVLARFFGDPLVQDSEGFSVFTSPHMGKTKRCKRGNPRRVHAEQIWRFPKIGIPPNHHFSFGFPLKNYFGVPPCLDRPYL